MHKPAKPETIGESNKLLVLNTLREQGEMSRADLSRKLGISGPAISSNVKALLEGGYIREVGLGDNMMGRKGTLLSFNESRGYVIGVDLGRFKIRVMLTDLLGEPLASLCESVSGESTEKSMVEQLLRLLQEVVEKRHKNRKDVLCICLGTPGIGELWKGAGRDCNNFVLINYGMGIGAALILNGKLFRGVNHVAGEMGVMFRSPEEQEQS